MDTSLAQTPVSSEAPAFYGSLRIPKSSIISSGAVATDYM